MRCRSVLTRVDALRTGELPADEQGRVHEHLEGCSSCEESLTDVEVLARSVRGLLGAPPRSCREAVSELLADGHARVDIDGGTVHVAFSRRGLRMLRRGGTDASFREEHAARYGTPLRPAALPADLRAQVVAAVRGEGVPRPRVDFGDGVTPLERDVLAILSRIPRGEVRTYEWLARQAGRPRAVRAVGSVCARNAVPLVVPCHRIVPSGGGVGSYLFGSDVKRALLKAEGVDVDALDALARRHVRYIGSKTTRIACFPTCKDARRIREENRVPFHGAEEAVKKGFRPCLRCQPFAA